MTESGGEARARTLGATDVAAIAVGAMMGVGIFFTPSKVADRAGSGGAALAVWAAGGVVALLGALTFAELGARIPEAGGQFRALKEAFGRRFGFVYAIVVGVGESCAAIAILALICVRNLAAAAGTTADAEEATLYACGLTLSAYGLAAAGVRQGATALNINVVVKLATAAAIAIFAATATPDTAEIASTTTPRVDGGGFGAVYAAFLPALFAYGGWQQTLWIGGAVREPGRNLPRGVIGGTCVVVAAYMTLNVAYMALLGYEGAARSQAIAADAASVAFAGAGRIVGACVAWSAFGCMQAIMLTGPHQTAALAETGLLPRLFAKRGRRGAPFVSTALFAAVSIAFVAGAGLERLDRLLDAVVCVDWIFFAFTGGALFVLRRRSGRPAGFSTPGYPYLPALFVVAAVFAAASPFFDDEARTGGTWALGAAAFVGLLSFVVVRKSTARGTDVDGR